MEQHLGNMTYMARKNEAQAIDEPKRSNCLGILDENIEQKVKSGDEPKVEPKNAQKAKREKSEKYCDKMCKENVINFEKQASAIEKSNKCLDKQGSLSDEPEKRM
eukprot:15259642-Ditylum_brightwellii.AAC.1